MVMSRHTLSPSSLPSCPFDGKSVLMVSDSSGCLLGKLARLVVGGDFGSGVTTQGEKPQQPFSMC